MSTTLQPAPRPSPLPSPTFPGAPLRVRPATNLTGRPATPFSNGGWTTPQFLQAYLLGSLLLAVLLCASGFFAYDALRTAIQSVGRDSVPSILAAQQIRASLVDMDASAAGDLLAGPNGSRTARDSYDAERSLIGRQIVTATLSITYGNLERIPIEQLQDGMTSYTGLIAQAQQQNRSGNGDAARMTFTQASAYLHGTLMPAAQRLDDVNTAYLNQTYGASGGTIFVAVTLVVLAGGLLLATLGGAQLFLTRRTRRILNLPLLAATVVLAVFLINTVSIALAVRGDLRTAKGNAFDSIAALSQARAAVYDANGNQTLALLDPTSAMRYQTQFNTLTQQIASTSVTPSVIDRASRTPKDPGFTGFLADELRNITFVGEQDAAITALTEFGNYQRANAAIVSLANMGQREQALALATGTNTDQAHRAFERFDIALVRTININKTAFDDAVTRSFAITAPLQWLSPVVAIVVALLSFAGLQPRLREYAV